jgi:uncharacterized glyoxalase superfamily protein PhnB
MPLARQVWGDEFGIMCTAKFSVPWMVNISEAAPE